MRRDPADRGPALLHLTNVPIAHATDVAESHVVCIDVTNFLSTHLDITADVVLCLHSVLARFILCNNLVLFISKGDLASDLVAHITHQHIEQVVSW